MNPQDIFSPIYRETNLVPEQIERQLSVWQNNYNELLSNLQKQLSGLVYQNDPEYIANANQIRYLKQTLPKQTDYQNNPQYISNFNEIRRLESAPPVRDNPETPDREDEIEAERRRLRILELTEQNESIRRQAEQGLTGAQKQATDNIRALTEQNERIKRDYNRRIQETNSQIDELNRRWKKTEAESTEQLVSSGRDRAIRSKAAQSRFDRGPSFDVPYLGEPQRALLEFRRPTNTAELLAQRPKRRVAPSLTPYGTYSPFQKAAMQSSGTWLPYMDYLTPPKLKDVPAGETSLDRLRRYDYLRLYQQQNIEQAKKAERQAAASRRAQEAQAFSEYSRASREMSTPTYEERMSNMLGTSGYSPEMMDLPAPSTGQGMRGLLASLNIEGMGSEYEKIRSQLVQLDPMNQRDLYMQQRTKLEGIEQRMKSAAETLASAQRKQSQQQQMIAENYRRNLLNQRSPGFQQMLDYNRAQNTRQQQANLQSQAARGFYNTPDQGVQTPYAYQTWGGA